MADEAEVIEKETTEIQEDPGVSLLGDFLGVEKPEVAKEETPIEYAPEVKAEMADYQGLLDKGYDNLTQEEKVKFDDYKGRYKTEESKEEKPEAKTEEPEAWKAYKDDDLLKLIEEGKFDEVTDDHIAFLKAKGYQLEVEEPATEEKPETPKEEPLYFAEKLKNVDYFKGKEFKTAQEERDAILEYISDQEATNKKVTDILTSSPELANVFSDLAKGKSAEEALRKHFEDLFNEEAPKPEDEGYMEWVEKKIEKRNALKAQQQEQAKRNENFQTSLGNMNAFVKTKGLNPAQSREFFERFDMITNQFAQNIVTSEMMDLVYKGFNYATDVANAEKKGEVKGRNIKIVKETTTERGDGMRRVVRNVPKQIKPETKYANDSAKALGDFLGI